VHLPDAQRIGQIRRLTKCALHMNCILTQRAVRQLHSTRHKKTLVLADEWLRSSSYFKCPILCLVGSQKNLQYLLQLHVTVDWGMCNLSRPLATHQRRWVAPLGGSRWVGQSSPTCPLTDHLSLALSLVNTCIRIVAG